jgi:predicted nucleic acid-binding protein
LSYLLDTNIISELRKGERGDANVARRYESLKDDEIYLSVLTIGELRRGVELIRRRDVTSAERLDAWLAEVSSGHEGRIVPVDRVVVERWGRMNVPDLLPVVDSLLAATAMTYRLTLATRNIKDVQGTGVPCVNPFA